MTKILKLTKHRFHSYDAMDEIIKVNCAISMAITFHQRIKCGITNLIAHCMKNITEFIAVKCSTSVFVILLEHTLNIFKKWVEGGGAGEIFMFYFLKLKIL